MKLKPKIEFIFIIIKSDVVFIYLKKGRQNSFARKTSHSSSKLVGQVYLNIFN